MKPIYLLGGVVVLAAVVLGALAFVQALTPYVSIAEAKASGRSVQVHGFLKETLGYDAGGRFRFVLVDEKGDEMTVAYGKSRPANFDQATGFVVIGRYDAASGLFLAEQVLVKCPSKYQEQGQEYLRERAGETAP